MSADTIDEDIRQITRMESPNLIENKRCFHLMLTDGARGCCWGLPGAIISI